MCFSAGTGDPSNVLCHLTKSFFFLQVLVRKVYQWQIVPHSYSGNPPMFLPSPSTHILFCLFSSQCKEETWRMPSLREVLQGAETELVLIW